MPVMTFVRQKYYKKIAIFLLIYFILTKYMLHNCHIQKEMMMKTPIFAAICAAALTMTPGFAAAQQTDFNGNSDFVANVSGHDVLQTANLDQAIDALKEEVSKADNDPALLINLGQAYARAGNFLMAEKSFLKARDSRKRYDILLANGDVMSTRAAAKEALKWLDNLQAGTAIARN